MILYSQTCMKSLNFNWCSSLRKIELILQVRDFSACWMISVWFCCRISSSFIKNSHNIQCDKASSLYKMITHSLLRKWNSHSLKLRSQMKSDSVKLFQILQTAWIYTRRISYKQWRCKIFTHMSFFSLSSYNWMTSSLTDFQSLFTGILLCRILILILILIQ